MSRYDVTEDPLCYPGTNVLRNKAELTVNGGVKPCHCGGAKVGHLVARLGA